MIYETFEQAVELQKKRKELSTLYDQIIEAQTVRIENVSLKQNRYKI